MSTVSGRPTRISDARKGSAGADRMVGPEVTTPRTRGMAHHPLNAHKVMLTATGLKIPVALSLDDWHRAGERLSSIADLTAWCLGDWLAYGMVNYSDRYRTVIEAIGLQYQTLRNYAWVARQFPHDRRRGELSFQHHAEVASLSPDQQDHWLDRATASAWTTKQLRMNIQNERRAVPATNAKPTLVPRVAVRGSRLLRWREAAQRSGTDVDTWIVDTLDRAAAAALDDTRAVESGT